MNSESEIMEKAKPEIQCPNFDLMCRFCLKCEPTLQPIFVKNEIYEGYTTQMPSFTKMIHFCIGLDVKKNDEFPKFLCFDCTNQLKNSYTFRQQCLSSLDKLKEFIVGRTQTNILPNDTSSTHHPAIKLENYLSVIVDDDDNAQILPTNINHSTITTKTKRKYTARKSRPKSLECIELENNYNEEKSNDNDNDDFAIDDDDHFNDNNDDYFDDQSIKHENLVDTKNIKLENIDAKVVKKRRDRKSGKNENDATATKKKNRGKYNKDKKSTKGQRRIPKERTMQICSICGEQRLSIENHMLTMHNDEKPCCCEICGKWIKTKSNLYRHHQRVHVAVRKYHCDICKFSFKSRAHIIRHMLSHSKIRNYECHVCGHRFRDSHTRNCHVRLHAEDKRIKCPYCDKRFMAPNRLKNHIGIHTGELPYNCELCPKQFKYSASSTIHRREHMINKQYYQCGSCEFQVKPFSLLKVHLRTEKHFFNEYFRDNDKET